MKKTFLAAILCACLAPVAVHALDPLASREERTQGMIFVKTPLPEADTVALTQSNGGFTASLKPGEMRWVPVGDYSVAVKMGDYNYQQNVTVRPTERTEVVVPGYGNLKVVSINPTDEVEVFQRGGKASRSSASKVKVVTHFPASQVKTLPTGHYDVKVSVGKTSVTKENVYVVTNTTREVVVSYKLSTR